MREALLERTLFYGRQFMLACQVSVAVLEYEARDFTAEMPCTFCQACQCDGETCDFRNTHLYGCYEAERWQGLYVYYCPLGLGFIAAVVYEGAAARYALVSGPVVIGSLADTLADARAMGGQILALPCRTPQDTTALSRLQWALCAYLSGNSIDKAEEALAAQNGIRNALYDATAEAQIDGEFRYPLEIEQQLQRMIIQGDRSGARELINRLLGELYFTNQGDLKSIKDNTKGLVVLFSRAAIEGGADARQIFGDTRQTFDTIDSFTELDELSRLLTSLFYRFVGYAFDFASVKNIDLVHKVLGYVRTHYAQRITMDDLAAHVNLSRAHLSRVLSEDLGMPFSEFVNAMRVEKSKELLRRPDVSLADIAGLTGFSDQSYFTKVFRKSVGMSPGEFRRKRGRQ